MIPTDGANYQHLDRLSHWASTVYCEALSPDPLGINDAKRTCKKGWSRGGGRAASPMVKLVKKEEEEEVDSSIGGDSIPCPCGGSF